MQFKKQGDTLRTCLFAQTLHILKHSLNVHCLGNELVLQKHMQKIQTQT